MKKPVSKPCPDLLAMNDDELRDFWGRHQPADLKALGDRLLAESLPRFAPRAEEFYPDNLAERRRALPISSSKMAELLGVNLNVLRSWEAKTLRPPASLSLIYAKTPGSQ